MVDAERLEGSCVVALACGCSCACNTGWDLLAFDKRFAFGAVSGTNYDVIEVGLLAPEPYPTGELLTGQVRGCSGLSVNLACAVFSVLRLWLHALDCGCMQANLGALCCQCSEQHAQTVSMLLLRPAGRLHAGWHEGHAAG